ncbi:MAG: single-stranded DNA-binding protein [Actinomycetia bacterium]|nr:single-stranded DNA-binding protein [Actinomycetes bacterium]
MTSQQTTPRTSTETANEVHLVGRVSAEPQTRTLPSGDELLTFRLIVARPPRRRATGPGERTQVDVIDIACWSAKARRAAARLQAEMTVCVEGSLRRRFFQTGQGAASRYEVEASAIRRR